MSTTATELSRRIERDGYALVEAVLGAEACDTVNAAIDTCRRSPGPTYRVLSKPGDPAFESELFRWRDVPAFRDLATKGPLPRLAAEVFGTESVVLMEDQWFCSEAGAGAVSPWHQDHPYHPLEPWFLTIWVALDDPPGPVGLKVATASHGTTMYGPVEFSAGDPTLDAGRASLAPVPDIEADPERWRVTVPPARKGDAILMDSRTLHAAGGPCSARFRRVSIRYAHPATRFVSRDWPVAEFWAEHDIAPGELLARDAFPQVVV